MVLLIDKHYWLSATNDLETSKFLHVGLSSTRNTGHTILFLDDHNEKHEFVASSPSSILPIG